MPDNALLLGPLLRHVDTATATVWVETRRAGTVQVRAGAASSSAATLNIAGHHYALVLVGGLAPGTTTPYEVLVDGARAWPAADDARPGPVIRTLPDPPSDDVAIDIVFGSCRVDRPHEPPYTLTADQDPAGVGVDSLVALAMACQGGRSLPDLLVMLGDQVYADEGLSPSVRQRQVERRGAQSDPKEEVADFEEYTWLYHESWATPEVRWLLATVPSTMIFDDHDVRDDWNTSEVWRHQMRQLGWWPERIIGAYTSYWLYQHLGNLSPAALAKDEVWQRVQVAEDPDAVLREFAAVADDEVDHRKRSQWSYTRTLGRSRLVVIDTRSGRLLEGEKREMLSEDEWGWLEECLTGDVEHLVVAASLPLVLEPAIHDIEAWDEAVAGGHAYGGRFSGLGEKLRQGADLEHWAAFEDSFRRLVGRLGAIAAGEHGEPPRSVLVISGDVHHSYIAPVQYPPSTGARSRVVQLVSSPLRNGFPRKQQRIFEVAHHAAARAVTGLLRRSAGLPRKEVSWDLTAGPMFGNGLAVLTLRGPTSAVRFERAEATQSDGRGYRLRVLHEERLV